MISSPAVIFASRIRRSMHLDLVQSISLAGDSARPNDDRAGASDRLGWVIDGATDLGEPGLVGARGGAAWLAMEADAAFAAADAAAPLVEIIAGVFGALGERFEAVRTRAPVSRWELPIAAFLAVRLGIDMLEIAWLGDCVGLLARGDSVERFGAVEASKEAEGAHAARCGGEATGRGAAVIESLRAARERPDRRVLGVEPAKARRARHEIAPGDELLLMTDGFAALTDVYAAHDGAALVAAMREGGLHPLAAELRALETGDAACTRWPRFKISDDATAIWFRVGGC